MTFVPVLVTYPNLARKGRRRVTPAERGEAVPAGGVVSPAPGRLRVKTPGRHYDRSAGSNPLHWDGRERVTPAPIEFRPRKRVNWS